MGLLRTYRAVCCTVAVMRNWLLFGALFVLILWAAVGDLGVIGAVATIAVGVLLAWAIWSVMRKRGAAGPGA